MSRSAEITIYPPETDVINHHTVNHNVVSIDPDDGSEWFMRRARLYVPPAYRKRSLENVLGITDRNLETVAEFCGASVLEHSWGLVPTESRPAAGSRVNTQAPPIPPGHKLVAKVRYIVSHKRPAESYWYVDKQCRKYTDGGIIRSRRLGDQANRQFLYGVPGGLSVPPQLFLGDIEPIYSGFNNPK